MAESWLINPRKTRRKTKRRKGRSSQRRRSASGQFIKTPKRKRGGSTLMARRKRRRSPVRRKRRSYRRNAPVAFRRKRRVARRYAGGSYRRKRRRSYRRNPPPVQKLGTELGWAAVGFMSTKFTGNLVTPMLAGIGGGNGQPIVRMGVKLGIAYGTAWLLENFMGRRVFVPAFVGGSIEVIQDFVRTFISPMVPMLAQAEYPLEVYYEPPLVTAEAENTIGDYYQPGGSDYQQM